MQTTDVIVVGAGASGLMCAAAAGRRDRRVLVLEQARKPGAKVLMAGGGRCNFTNYDVSADNYSSHNPHFCKSALSRYTQWDFLDLVGRYGIAWHERDHGQLFCDESSRDILDLLLRECDQAGVQMRFKRSIETIERIEGEGFRLGAGDERYQCRSLVIATGGLSIPTSGASPFGYRVAQQFGIKVWQPAPALVPLTLQPDDLARFAPLAGIAVDCVVSNERTRFRENLLFTHRGLSGPVILQISTYWRAGEAIQIDWLPDEDLLQGLPELQQRHPKQLLRTTLSRHLPARLAGALLPQNLAEQPLNRLGSKEIVQVAQLLHHWSIRPNGTEGYRTAEVTRGGVDCDAVSSKTMECVSVPGLYFIGELLDVTGWLGGYNLQWAWSSGWCAGQYA